MCLVGRRTSHHNNNMHSVSKRIEIELELFYSSLTHSIFFSLFIYFPFLSFCLWSKYNSFLFQYVERIFFRSSEMQLTLNGPKREAQTSKRSQEGERPSEADNQNLNSKVKSRKSKKRGSPKRETDSFCVYDECHLKGAHTTTLTFQWGGGGEKETSKLIFRAFSFASENFNWLIFWVCGWRRRRPVTPYLERVSIFISDKSPSFHVDFSFICFRGSPFRETTAPLKAAVNLQSPCLFFIKSKFSFHEIGNHLCLLCSS